MGIPRRRVKLELQLLAYITATAMWDLSHICELHYSSWNARSLTTEWLCVLCLWFYLYFVNKFICIIFLDSTYKWYHMIFVFLLLTSLSMIISRSIYVAANDIISFFLQLSNIPLCICTTFSLFIPLLMDIKFASMSWLL